MARKNLIGLICPKPNTALLKTSFSCLLILPSLTIHVSTAHGIKLTSLSFVLCAIFTNIKAVAIIAILAIFRDTFNSFATFHNMSTFPSKQRFSNLSCCTLCWPAFRRKTAQIALDSEGKESKDQDCTEIVTFPMSYIIAPGPRQSLCWLVGQQL